MLRRLNSKTTEAHIPCSRFVWGPTSSKLWCFMGREDIELRHFLQVFGHVDVKSGRRTCLAILHFLLFKTARVDELTSGLQQYVGPAHEQSWLFRIHIILANERRREVFSSLVIFNFKTSNKSKHTLGQVLNMEKFGPLQFRGCSSNFFCLLHAD